jgi:methylitaconate Delta-isomerase
MEQRETHVVIMRAGTSKGIFIKEENLPKDQKERDELILKVFGSPDVRQIDGLGGADPLTSKLAIIGPATRADADVDYTFAQVSYVAPKIDYSGNCGNISAGVGPFAVDQGLVKVEEPYTTVRVHNTNTGKILVERVEVENGKAKVTGDYSIAGVPGTGSEITIDFSDTAGSSTGKLLPTGNAIDKIDVTGYGEIEVSLVDAANPVVFLRAKDLNLTGIETPSQIDENKKLLATLEEIRGKGAVVILLKERKSVKMMWTSFQD